MFLWQLNINWGAACRNSPAHHTPTKLFHLVQCYFHPSCVWWTWTEDPFVHCKHDWYPSLKTMPQDLTVVMLLLSGSLHIERLQATQWVSCEEGWGSGDGGVIWLSGSLSQSTCSLWSLQHLSQSALRKQAAMFINIMFANNIPPSTLLNQYCAGKYTQSPVTWKNLTQDGLLYFWYTSTYMFSLKKLLKHFQFHKVHNSSFV